MAVRLWPQDYERKDHITKAEKALLRKAAANFKSGHFAVDIDPLGMSSKDVKMGFYISTSEGLVTFSIKNGNLSPDYIEAYKQGVKFVEDKIYERLLDSKLLIVRQGEYKSLKFPYKHIFLFPEERLETIKLSQDQKENLSGFVALGFFQPTNIKGKARILADLRIFTNFRKGYDSDFSSLSELECKAIFERLAPEYTVVMTELENAKIENKKRFLSEDALKITGRELEYKTFFLDEYQVSQVNDTGRGHRVILANPGAGKSVLLLSKAYKYASMYKESRVLLTCYNNNLADSYLFKRSCANFGDNNNLYIMTFHKLVKKIYQECLGVNLESNIASEEEIQKCIEAVKLGKIQLSFKAILIDEVQIFDPLYLELCYLLLEKEEDSLFLMAGDLNQAVRALSRKGDAPWKKIAGTKLDFTGRVKYIEKNYRNSQAIGEYIKSMLSLMNKRLSMLGLIDSMEYEYNTFKIGSNPTTALKIKTGIDRNNIKQEVATAITEITNKHKIPYSDIAVIFPYKQHKRVMYFFMNWMEALLNEKGIPYSIITQAPGKKKFSDTNGVVLTTIDSSLGLDFKAVIFAGLYPYNFVFSDEGKQKKIKSWEAIRKMDDEYQSKFQSQMRSMYTACSRARDVLYVLSDLDEGSPMEEILKK